MGVPSHAALTSTLLNMSQRVLMGGREFVIVVSDAWTGIASA